MTRFLGSAYPTRQITSPPVWVGGISGLGFPWIEALGSLPWVTACLLGQLLQLDDPIAAVLGVQIVNQLLRLGLEVRHADARPLDELTAVGVDVPVRGAAVHAHDFQELYF